MTGAGLKKCRPTTRSGCSTPAASSVTDSEDVLVASTQSPATAPASSANSSRLRSSRSGAASMTTAHGASSAAASTVSTRSTIASASAAVMRPLATGRSRPLAMRSRAAPSASGTGSCSSVRAPA